MNPAVYTDESVAWLRENNGISGSLIRSYFKKSYLSLWLSPHLKRNHYSKELFPRPTPPASHENSPGTATVESDWSAKIYNNLSSWLHRTIINESMIRVTRNHIIRGMRNWEVQLNNREETKASSWGWVATQTWVTPNTKATKNRKRICKLEKAKESETFSTVTILVKSQALFPRIRTHKFLTFVCVI